MSPGIELVVDGGVTLKAYVNYCASAGMPSGERNAGLRSSR